jgi:hypothetical protein
MVLRTVQRRIFGPERDEGMEEWRQLHNELNELYSSNIWVIKYRRMRWVGEEWCMKGFGGET